MSTPSTTREQKLRSDRLVFYEKDVDGLNQELDGFLELSQARAAFVIDREGHLVTRRGECGDGSLESIAALVAGSFAATREMARLMGEQEFSTMVHQGRRDSIQICLVGDRALFAAVFDGRTNLGLVRWHSRESCERLAGLFQRIVERVDEPGSALPSDFGKDAAAALDKLF